MLGGTKEECNEFMETELEKLKGAVGRDKRAKTVKSKKNTPLVIRITKNTKIKEFSTPERKKIIAKKRKENASAILLSKIEQEKKIAQQVEESESDDIPARAEKQYENIRTSNKIISRTRCNRSKADVREKRTIEDHDDEKTSEKCSSEKDDKLRSIGKQPKVLHVQLAIMSPRKMETFQNQKAKDRTIKLGVTRPAVAVEDTDMTPTTVSPPTMMPTKNEHEKGENKREEDNNRTTSEMAAAADVETKSSQTSTATLPTNAEIDIPNNSEHDNPRNQEMTVTTADRNEIETAAMEPVAETTTMAIGETITEPIETKLLMNEKIDTPNNSEHDNARNVEMPVTTADRNEIGSAVMEPIVETTTMAIGVIITELVSKEDAVVTPQNIEDDEKIDKEDIDTVNNNTLDDYQQTEIRMSTNTERKTFLKVRQEMSDKNY